MSFQYDLNGNTIQKTDGGEDTNYFYNIEDRLTRVEDGSGNLIAEYYYDPFGRRLWKDVSETGTYFMYADEGLIGEFDASGSQTTAYGYVPNSTWTTNPLFMNQGSQYYFYHNDHLGTPQKMTAINGATAWTATYESYGMTLIAPASTTTNNLRFPGQYFDAETGLHYNYRRYYDPSTGRYSQEDPIGLNGGTHFYIYAYLNPLAFGDPLGLRSRYRKEPAIPYVAPQVAPETGAPGDDRPPRGTTLPFLGTTYTHLWRYTFETFLYDGVIDLSTQVDPLVQKAAANIPCGQIRVFYLYFKIRSSGIKVFYISDSTRETTIGPDSGAGRRPTFHELEEMRHLLAVTKDIIGVKGCFSCGDDIHPLRNRSIRE